MELGFDMLLDDPFELDAYREGVEGEAAFFDWTPLVERPMPVTAAFDGAMDEWAAPSPVMTDARENLPPDFARLDSIEPSAPSYARLDSFDASAPSVAAYPRAVDPPRNAKAQKPQVNIDVRVDAKPVFQMGESGDVMDRIRPRIGELAELIGGDLAHRIGEILGNTPVGVID